MGKQITKIVLFINNNLPEFFERENIFIFSNNSQGLGASLLTISIIIRTDDALYEYGKALELDRYYTACYICMAIGVLLIVLSFIGCLGAAVESPCILVFVSIRYDLLTRVMATFLMSQNFVVRFGDWNLYRIGSSCLCPGMENCWW